MTRIFTDFYFRELPRAERDEMISRLRRFLESFQAISFAYVFGSFITGMPFRDIDVAVYYDEGRVPRERLTAAVDALADEASHSLRELFDVVALNLAPAHFALQVFKDGILLFVRDERLLKESIENCSIIALSNESISFQSLKEIVG
jgi:uncharacterized protein